MLCSGIIVWHGRCRFGKGRMLGPYLMRLLFQRLEFSVTLALAFCHAHELAVQDMAKYGTLAGWDEEQEREQAEAARLGVHVHLDDLLDQMRANALQQVCLNPSAWCIVLPCSAGCIAHELRRIRWLLLQR